MNEKEALESSVKALQNVCQTEKQTTEAKSEAEVINLIINKHNLI